MKALYCNELIKLYQRRTQWGMLMVDFLAVGLMTALNHAAFPALTLSNNWLNDVILGTTLAVIFIIITAATLLTSEFDRGTIRFLLVRPHGHTQILFAKLLVLLTSVWAHFTVLWASSYLFNWLLIGFFPIASWDRTYQFGQYMISTAFVALFFATLTLLFAAGMRSRSLAIVISLSGYFVSSLIGSLLSAMIRQYEWLKWNPLNMTNLTNLLGTKNHVSAITAALGLNYNQMFLGLVVYIVLFYAGANWIFGHRDIP
ncbi:hypothetical protein IV38_GL001772 [Lactobacillus selangorensis]|uniref:ABC transporter permease n=1 Tax=Lactobacillus selangorensis TaxID=81857 RepID=A0A0R2FW23_9LACO|nr:ABC transporter permease subunit [Lactobacillus selangorensis]KRN27932.1 hypothetical protein IV38_GL001772 [Lactobacillus selangorensis]KRN30597.1 hypothetical protein IV40_GL001784 [Lactobacillus selangorensis]